MAIADELNELKQTKASIKDAEEISQIEAMGYTLA